MTRSLSQIKEDSRNSLAGNYLLYFFVIVLTGLLTMAANQIVSFLAWPFGNAGFFLLTLVNLILDFLVMILAKMLQAGQLFLALNIARFNRVSVGDLFLAFRYDTAKAFRLCAILALVETICRAPFSVSLSNLVYVGAFTINSGKNVPVWSILLLSLCGLAGMIFLEVMVAFPLSQALFLYIDHQELSAGECLSKSRSLMRGHVTEFFLLHLSLAGYFALCVISMGLGLVWVLPYLNVIKANYYMNLTGTFKPY